MMDKQILLPKDRCPRCGAEFVCCKSGKCWCFEVNVLPQTREAINKKYDTCLCPDCLNLLAANPHMEP